MEFNSLKMLLGGGETIQLRLALFGSPPSKWLEKMPSPILYINSRSPCVRPSVTELGCKSGQPGPARHSRTCTWACGLRIEVRLDDDAGPLELLDLDDRDT